MPSAQGASGPYKTRLIGSSPIEGTKFKKTA